MDFHTKPVPDGAQVAAARDMVRRCRARMWKSCARCTTLSPAVRSRPRYAESWHFRGRQDIALDFDIVDVYTFRDGLIAEVEGFADRKEASASLGLSA